MPPKKKSNNIWDDMFPNDAVSTAYGITNDPSISSTSKGSIKWRGKYFYDWAEGQIQEKSVKDQVSELLERAERYGFKMPD